MTVRRLRRSAAVGVAGVLAGTLALGGCTSSGTPHASGAGAPTTKPKPVASIAVTPSASEQLNPLKPVSVHVSNGTLTSVSMVNPVKGTKVKGELSPDKKSWSSAEPLAYKTAYQLTADATGTDGKAVEKKSTVNTLKPANLTYPSLIPPPSISDVGVGQPIVIRFDEDIPNRAAAEKALNVQTEPKQEGSWYWISDREVHYRPKEYWQPGTQINLHIGVYGKDLGGGLYGESDRDLHMTVHDSWVARANGANQQMAIYHNGALVRTMPISMGKEETPTHVGTHVISDKDRVYTMDSCTYGVCSGPDAYRTKEFYSMRISNDGEFVHENPDSVGSQGNTNVSHGCVNLNEANAIWFFNHFNLGDVVEVVNSGGPLLPVYDTYGDWSVPWGEWQAGSALQH